MLSHQTGLFCISKASHFFAICGVIVAFKLTGAAMQRILKRLAARERERESRDGLISPTIVLIYVHRFGNNVLITVRVDASIYMCFTVSSVAASLPFISVSHNNIVVAGGDTGSKCRQIGNPV